MYLEYELLLVYPPQPILETEFILRKHYFLL